MKTFNLLALLFILVTAVSCSFDVNSSVDDKREANDNAYLNEKFSRITGLYQGTVSASDGDQKADLTLYVISVPNGKNSRGEAIFKPELRAYYRRTDTITTDLILEARYFDSQVPAILSISNFSGQVSTPQTISATFTVEGATLKGTVSTGAGLLGPASFVLTDRNASGPAQNDIDDENARREALFAPVLGSYYGTVLPDNQKETPPFGVSMRLFVDKRKDANDNYLSILRGRLHRDDTIGDGSDLFMDIDFSPDKNPPKITLSVTGWVKDKPSAFPNYIFVGTIKDGTISTIFTGNGYNGKAKLLRR